MAWPKGRKRSQPVDVKHEKFEPQSLPVVVQEIVKAKKPAPSDTDIRTAANREIMLCYITGKFVPRALRIHWDQRNVPIVDAARKAMARDGAKPEQAEEYLDRVIASTAR